MIIKSVKGKRTPITISNRIDPEEMVLLQVSMYPFQNCTTIILNQNKSNVILITHALTGSHKPVKEESCKIFNNGWWDKLIRSKKVIDTDKFFVISTNVIGSVFGSTSPLSPINPLNPKTKQYRFDFPVITIKDMVKAQKILLDSLGIRHLKAIIGGSMGGMQALRFAVDFPGFCENIIPIATTYQTNRMLLQ